MLRLKKLRWVLSDSVNRRFYGGKFSGVVKVLFWSNCTQSFLWFVGGLLPRMGLMIMYSV